MPREFELLKPFEPTPLIDTQRAAAEAEENRVGLGLAAEAAFEAENSLSFILNQDGTQEPDPNFLFDDDTFKEVTDGIPEQYWDFTEDAVSLDHAFKLREKVLQELENEQILSSYGFTGFGLRVAASVVDPVAIGASVASEGVLAPAIFGAKATRLGRAIRGLAGGSLAAAPVETFLNEQAYTRDAYDVLIGVGSAGLLSSAVGGAFGRTEYDRALEKIVKDAETAQAVETLQASRMVPRQLEVSMSQDQAAIKLREELLPVAGGRFDNQDLDELQLQKETLQRQLDEVDVETDTRVTLEDLIRSGEKKRTAKRKADELVQGRVNDLKQQIRRVDEIFRQDNVRLKAQRNLSRLDQGQLDKLDPEFKARLDELMTPRTETRFVEEPPVNKLEPAKQSEITQLKEARDNFNVQQRAVQYLEANPNASQDEVLEAAQGELDEINRRINEIEEERFQSKSVGAMENPFQPSIQTTPLRTDADEVMAEAADSPMATYGDFRFDMVGLLKNSEAGTARRAASLIGEDGVGFNKAGEVNEITADIIKTRDFQKFLVNYHRVHNEAYKDYAKEQGIGMVKRNMPSYRREFNELVADAIEDPTLDVPPQVRKVADKQAELQRQLLREAQEAGVLGFDQIPEDLSYFTHLWQARAFAELNDTIGTDVVIDALTNAILSGIRKGGGEMDDAIARRIATSMNKTLRRKEAGMDAGMARMFTASSKDDLRDILIEEKLFSETEADDLISRLREAPDGRESRAKSRIAIDTQYVLKDKNGKDLIRIKDLMNRDASEVFVSYANQMTGATAMARKGIKSDSDFNRIIQQVRAEFAELGKDPQSTVERLETMYALIKGRSPTQFAAPSSKYARVSRLVNDWNFLRLMNQVGFAQFSELGNAIGADGIRGFVRQLPEFKKVLTRAKNGDIEDELINEIEVSSGYGGDRMINLMTQRYDYGDDLGIGRGTGFLDRALDKSLNVLQPLKTITADLSGLAPITLGLQRQTARIVLQKFADAAEDFSTISAERLASLGIDDAMFTRIKAQIKQNATLEDSTMFRGRKLRALNLDGWDDPEAAEALVFGALRWSRRAIQQNDVGNLSMWMTSATGRMVSQFRTFMLVSWTKQFMYNIKANDMNAYLSMMYMTFFAGLGYTTQQAVNGALITDSAERKKFFDDRLNATEIGKAAFQRSGWVSFFPSAVDTMYSFYDDQPIFAYGRTTGLASDFVNGIPAVDLGNKVLSTGRGATRAILNESFEWSQQEQRNVNQLLPFQNALVIKQILDLTVEPLPRYANDDF